MADKMIEKIEHQSKIVSMRIENFMSIKNALIEFDDSNIVSLCGYNDSGKSAITRLFEIMFYNTYSIDQVKFITDNEDYWLGELKFSDGVVYTRIKYLDGKSLWELKKDDTVLFTNRLPNGTLAAMGDTPEVIVKYLGVIQDELTGEELNVRRNTDKLFLINTSGGDNYKILNSVLRSDVLSSASKSLNDDKNRLNSEVSEKNTVKNVLEEQLESIDVPPQDIIEDIKATVTKLDDIKGKVVRVSLIMEEVKTLHSISVFDSLIGVDTSRLKLLQDILTLSQNTQIPVYNKVDSIDTERLVTLRNILELKKKLNVSTYNSLEKVDVDRVKDIVSLGEVYNTYKGTEQTYNKINVRLEEIKQKLKDLSIQYNLKVCQNCGAIVG